MQTARDQGKHEGLIVPLARAAWDSGKLISKAAKGIGTSGSGTMNGFFPFFVFKMQIDAALNFKTGGTPYA